MDWSVSPTVQDVPGIVGRGIDNYRKSILPLSGMAVVVIGLYGGARLTAQRFVDSGDLGVAFAIDAIGLIVASIIALPWFKLALAIESEEPYGMDSPGSLQWGSMVVASLFFWGGVLLGIRYMVGIPSIFVLIWYGFFGFAVAAGVKPGLTALGHSVRLGQGRRWIVAMMAFVLGFINLLGALPIGAGINVLTVVAAVLLLIVTTNVSMGAGAHLFHWLDVSEEI